MPKYLSIAENIEEQIRAQISSSSKTAFGKRTDRPLSGQQANNPQRAGFSEKPWIIVFPSRKRHLHIRTA